MKSRLLGIWHSNGARRAMIRAQTITLRSFISSRELSNAQLVIAIARAANVVSLLLRPVPSSGVPI